LNIDLSAEEISKSLGCKNASGKLNAIFMKPAVVWYCAKYIRTARKTELERTERNTLRNPIGLITATQKNDAQ
jgi:hypothetical protein